MCPTISAFLSRKQEPHRLAELRRQLTLDATEERIYDDLTRLLASSLEVPIAMITLVEGERDWCKSRVGLPLRQSAAEKSCCDVFFTAHDDIVVIEDATLNARFASHPFVTGAPFVRFYAAAPLTVGGRVVGMLCVRDDKPRQISVTQIRQMQALANAVAELLNQRAISNAMANVISCDLRLLSPQL